jgi:hypothetical protein
MTTHHVAILKRSLPVIIVMVFILLMSTTPGAHAGPLFRMFTGPVRAWLRGTGYLAFLTRLDWLKVGHVIGYGVLGLVLYRAVMLTSRQGSSAVPEHKRPQAAMRVQHSLECCRSARMSGLPSPGLLLPTTLVFGFACLDEFVQYFVPGRSARLSDVILDTTAALLVMVVIKLLADRWASVR